MVEAVFVTGTDTGIGKTVVSAALALKWKAAYWKPVQSGLLPQTDSEWVSQVTGLEVLPEAYRLKAPLSPHASAKAEGITISMEKFVLPKNRPLVVEGAGGVLVPLNENALMIDLMKHLSLPVLVVARSTLGTINHTLMTLSILRERQVPIMGVVMNGPLNPSNKEAIEYYGRVKIWEAEPLDKLDRDSLLRLCK